LGRGPAEGWWALIFALCLKMRCYRPAAGPLPQPLSRKRARGEGFTLLEVLVALAITAIVLIAGMKATSSLTDNAARQRQALLAGICAQNQLIALRLAHGLPGVGDSTSTCTQAGFSMQVRQSVRPTPNPNFRRVDASVSEDGVPILTLTTIVGNN